MSRQMRIGLTIGGLVCLASALIGGIASPTRFFQAYLVAYAFWIGLALGCLGLALIHSLTGGRWGLVTRPIFASGAATLPVLAVLFLPVLAGVARLYPWTMTSDFRTLYLNVPFFVGRAVVYFAVWIGISRLPRRWHVLGLIALGLTASFAAIDWWMSLEPEWLSTMYPPLICVGDLLVALAFALVLVTRRQAQAPPELLNDLGSLLLAVLMVWAYMTYFQYMLIWSGNLTDEITWYVRRSEGAWLPVAWSVAGLGFVVPFALLLFRRLKRNRRALASIAALLVCTRVLELYWLLEPAFSPSALVVDWMWPLAWVGIGAIWLVVFSWRLAAEPPVLFERAPVTQSSEAARAQA